MAELGRELSQQRQADADHVVVVALDALDEPAAQTVEASSDEEREYWSKGKVLRLRGRDAPTNTYRSAVTAAVD